MAKFLAAQGCCNGPTCTLECKQAVHVAFGTLDGSCCDQLGMGADAAQQCHIAMTTQIVPLMKQVVAEKCPSNFNFNFDFVANGLIDVKFSEQRVPSVVLIADDLMQCVRAMFMVAQGSCNGPTCILECKPALLVAIGTLDGSCCDQL